MINMFFKEWNISNAMQQLEMKYQVLRPNLKRKFRHLIILTSNAIVILVEFLQHLVLQTYLSLWLKNRSLVIETGI